MKRIMVLLFAVIMLISLAACGSKAENGGKKNNSGSENNSKKEENNSKNGENNLNNASSPEQIEEAIRKALGDSYYATVDVPSEELFTCVLSGVDLEKLSSYVAKISAIPSINPDSVVVVKCKDASYADEVIDTFNENYAGTVGYARLYSFSIPKVEGARIYKQGDTVIFVLAGATDDSGDLEKAAKLAADEYAKVDEAIKKCLGSLPENRIVIPEDNGNDVPQDINDDNGGIPLIGG